MTEKNIPSIRFDEFKKLYDENGSDSNPENPYAWEQRKLGEFGKATGGTSIESEFIDNGKYKVISIGSYSESSVYVDQGIRVEKTLKTENKILNKGDLTMILNDKTSSGNIIGRVLLVDKEDTYVYNQRTQRIEVFKDKYEAKFLYQLLNADNLRMKIIKAAQGNTQIYVNWSAISKLFYRVPNLSEQTAIGTFFQTLDHLIALHQREYEKTVNFKKAMLEKMFPKEGEKNPEIRFEKFKKLYDENGGDSNPENPYAWEQRKLDEVSDIYDGTHQTPKYQDDGVMFLSVENIKTLTSNKFISREAFEDEFKIRPQRGDVLMTRIGDIGTANVVETDEDLAYYVSLALFKSEELNPYFLQASIHAPFVQDQIWKRTLHIAFPKKINKNEIGQVPINVPILAEQTKIGELFKQLNSTIALQQRELEKLKNIKKALLGKLLV